MKYSWLLLPAVGPLVFVAGCTDAGTAGLAGVRADSRVQRLVVSADTMVIDALGATHQLSAAAFDGAGNGVATRLQWHSLSAEVVRVDSTGLVTAHGAGETAVVVKAACCAAADTVHVQVAPRAVSIVVLPSEFTLPVGESMQLHAVMYDRLGNIIVGRNASWSVSDGNRAVVDSQGVLTTRYPGAVTVFARADSAGGDARIEVLPGRYDVPARIDAEGTADVTRQLLEFFQSVPDGSIIHFQAGARHRVEGTLLIRDRHDLTFVGNGALIFATDPRPANYAGAGTYPWRTRSHWHLIGGSNLVFVDLVVRGAHPNGGVDESAYRVDLEAQHGFDVQGTAGLVLERVRVTDVYGDFVYLSNRRDSGLWSSNIRIVDSHFERNGRQGIALAGTRDVLIERNYIGQTRRASLDLEPYSVSSGISNVTVRNNTFGPGRLLFLAAGSTVQARISDISIENNRLQGKTMNITMTAPVGGVRHRNIRIESNVTDLGFGGSQALMTFTRVDGVEVRLNSSVLASGRNMVGVRTIQSCAVVVRNNDFANAIMEADIQPFQCN
jgi:hypothetical protein